MASANMLAGRKLQSSQEIGDTSKKTRQEDHTAEENDKWEKSRQRSFSPSFRRSFKQEPLIRSFFVQDDETQAKPATNADVT